MSVSVIFSTRIPAMMPSSSLGSGTTSAFAAPISVPKIGGGGGMGLAIECSSRPQKKATAHHMKTRPRKSQPWDIRRRPTVYPPLPPLPPDWTVVGTVSEADVDVEVANVASPPPLDE